MQLIRNPNIIPNNPEADKDYYYAFDLLCYGKKHLHYYLLNYSKHLDHYVYHSLKRREIFYYPSHINIFKNLYLTFFTNEDTHLMGSYHDYFILSPSVEVVIRKEYPYA